MATEHRPIFENGVLKTYFFDTYNAKKMGVAPTISGPSRLVLTPVSYTHLDVYKRQTYFSFATHIIGIQCTVYIIFFLFVSLLPLHWKTA